MSDDLLALLEGGLRLPPQDRARLAAKLLESIADERIEDESETHWEDEIRRRVEDIESGRVHGVPWATVKAEIETMIAKRRGG